MSDLPTPVSCINDEYEIFDNPQKVCEKLNNNYDNYPDPVNIEATKDDKNNNNPNPKYSNQITYKSKFNWP